MPAPLPSPHRVFWHSCVHDYKCYSPRWMLHLSIPPSCCCWTDSDVFALLLWRFLASCWACAECPSHVCCLTPFQTLVFSLVSTFVFLLHGCMLCQDRFFKVSHFSTLVRFTPTLGTVKSSVCVCVWSKWLPTHRLGTIGNNSNALPFDVVDIQQWSVIVRFYFLSNWRC